MTEQYHQPTWLGWHDRTLHSTAAEYIYFSSVQGPERPHSGSKPSFSKFKRIQIIKTCLENSQVFGNKTTSKQPKMKSKMKMKISKYFELNENEKQNIKICGMWLKCT